MVVKLLAFWARSEPLTPLRFVRGSAFPSLGAWLRISAAYSAALHARLSISVAGCVAPYLRRLLRYASCAAQ